MLLGAEINTTIVRTMEHLGIVGEVGGIHTRTQRAHGKSAQARHSPHGNTTGK